MLISCIKSIQALMYILICLKIHWYIDIFRANHSFYFLELVRNEPVGWDPEEFVSDVIITVFVSTCTHSIGITC